MSRVLHFSEMGHWIRNIRPTDAIGRSAEVLRTALIPANWAVNLLEERKLLSVSLLPLCDAGNGIKPTYIVERHFLTGPNVAAFRLPGEAFNAESSTRGRQLGPLTRARA